MNSKKPTGRFTRFINDGKKIKADGKVKPKAFYPTNKEKTHISVFSTETLIESDIWNLGFLHIEPTVAGRADLDGSCVFNIGMRITIDNTVPMHAQLGPFPDVTSSSDKELRDLRSQLAAKLADISNVKRYTGP